MTKKKISIVLVGVGGYGNIYAEHLLQAENETFNLVGVVDIHPEGSKYYDQFMAKNIPVYPMIEDFYDHKKADLAIISTPIQYHAPQTCYALKHGSHVLCEKPISPTIEEAKAIMETEKETGRFVAIGFNWSFSPSVLQLKQDIIKGDFGKPKRLKTIVLWPRSKKYFTRSPWAGRIRSDDGAWIRDSVANNATAHYLHHMFYMLGASQNESAKLCKVTAELYRANDIENFDTCAVRAETTEGTEILYYATHDVKDQKGPTFVYEFEKATLSYTNGHKVIARFHNGETKTYPDPNHDQIQKLWTCIEAVESENLGVPCGPKAAYTHASCIHAMHESVPDIKPFPQTLIQLDEKSETLWVEGLNETMMDCYHQWCLPSEIGITWAEKGKTIEWMPS